MGDKPGHKFRGNQFSGGGALETKFKGVKEKPENRLPPSHNSPFRTSQSTIIAGRMIADVRKGMTEVLAYKKTQRHAAAKIRLARMIKAREDREEQDRLEEKMERRRWRNDSGV
jgi:hypothetical protein